MMLTLVVESDRVRAAVKSAHMAALKRRFMRKKKPRTATSTIVFEGSSDRLDAMWDARDEVNAVVVLH